MQNYNKRGKTLELEVPVGDCESGEGYMFGGLLVVAHKDGTAGERESFESEGVFEMAKDGVADFDEGEICYWDDSAKQFKDSAAGYYGAAYCVKAAAAADSTVLVKLMGHPVPVVT